MTARWLIETRLGDDPGRPPLRRRVIIADSEAEALRLAAEDAVPAPRAAAGDQLLMDGQEEVFARAEVEAGPEHPTAAGGAAPSAAAKPERRRDR